MKPARPSSKKDVNPARKSNRKAKKSIKPYTDKDIKPDRPVNKKESSTQKGT